MSSRIFIKNLPPSKFTEIDFREHFGKFAAVTDVKLIPNRRIGYVGFKSPEDAERAVKYFNKTFIRMSRIAVEIARPIADNNLPRPWSAHTPGSSAYQRKHELKIPAQDLSNSLKRKRDKVERPNPATDAKLQEFLEVMQPSSHAKTWSNCELAVTNQDSAPMIQAEEGESDDEFVDIKTKPTKSKDMVTTDGLVFGTDNVEEDLLKVSTEDALTADPKFAEEEQRAITDEEWLRSRTSRLLDLTDDIEGHLAQQTTATGKPPVPKITETEESSIMQTEANENSLAVTAGGQKSQEEDGEEYKAEVDAIIAEIGKSGRLFLRNLPYTTTEEELWQAFEPFGELEEAHLVLDIKTNQSKGFAFVLYKSPANAVDAYRAMEKKIFQGRLLHIIAGAAKRENKLDEFAIAKLPLKKQLELKKKSSATNSFNWNSMYMNIDAVISSMAERLGVSKSELLDPASTDAAVKQAHAETQVIQETKQYFKDNGVNLEAFGKNPKYKQKDDKVILIKNFPYGTTQEEITKMFGEFGELRRVLMPPAGTIAIVEFVQAPIARAAYSSMAYRRFRNTVLFLEKAPKDLLDPGFVPAGTSTAPTTGTGPDTKVPKVSAQEFLQPDEAEEVDTTTLYVRNLNFSTTTATLTKVFSSIDGFRKATVKMKNDPKKPGATLSMGFGFVEFKTKAQAHAAMAAMNGYTLDGYQLLVKASHRGADAAAERRKDDIAKKAVGNKTKVILKNLPFEATEKDIRRLVAPYGKLKAVRLPKKFGSRSSGFAFAEFISSKEAATAMDTLKDTHFLGRKLVLEWSSQDAVSAEEEIEKMQKKAGRQSSLMATQALRESNKRRKFNIDGGGEVD